MTRRPSRTAIVLAFLAVYIIWGSTYLGIRLAVETLPPFLMAGARCLAGGAILYAVARLRGNAAPARAHWRAAAIVGALLFLGGNGLLSWSEQYVPSGIASLLVSTVSLWMVILAWIEHPSGRPGLPVIAGLALGFGGLALLVGPAHLAGGTRVQLLPAAALTLGSIAWAAGSVYSQRVALPSSPILAAGMEMLCGGASLLLAGLLSGETARFHLAAVSLRSVLAVVYLLLFGSLVGFTAYVFILAHSTAARVATYAYVNPVIAVLLGWAIGGESLNARVLLAAAVTLSGVAFIVSAKSKPRAAAARAASAGAASAGAD